LGAHGRRKQGGPRCPRRNLCRSGPCGERPRRGGQETRAREELPPIQCGHGRGFYTNPPGTDGLSSREIDMSYRTPLEARLAKKTTRAITDFGLIEDGDRVMVGLS